MMDNNLLAIGKKWNLSAIMRAILEKQTKSEGTDYFLAFVHLKELLAPSLVTTADDIIDWGRWGM